MASSSSAGSIRENDRARSFIFEYHNTIAASAGSLCSTLAGFPLDSVKSRLQVKRYSSVLDCVRTTFAEEGLPGFFRGVAIPLVTITLVRTTSFAIYTNVRDSLKKRGILADGSLASAQALGFLGGASSGLALSVGTVAFEYTKVAMQLDYLISMKRGLPYEPKGTLEAFRYIQRRDGFKALFTGFSLHCTRDTVGTGVYFALNDSFRYLFDRHHVPNVSGTPLAVFASGSLSGLLSWFVIYPIDLVKTRVQRDALAGLPPESSMSIFRRMSNKGVARLYRGLGVSATRSLITHGLMWTVYDLARQRLYEATKPDLVD